MSWQQRAGSTRIGLVVHGGRPAARTAAHQAAQLLRSPGVELVGCLSDGWSDAHIEERDDADFGVGLDVVLVFGGDGTFLRAAYLARDRGVPLLLVNLGRLGFLAEVEVGDVPEAVGRVLAGDFVVEERMTLTIDVCDAQGAVTGTSWALNEASVERTVPQRLVVLEVRVGETLFAQVPGDGVILATPTGSTAYAFSAGGPIMSPLVNAILLQPVAPHSLFDRTLVVEPGESLSVRPVTEDNPCVVSCDGRQPLRVPLGGEVRVARGDAPVRLARLGRFDFYKRVREKFGLR
ncbi:MAG TPA: NAD(+)/NADH kinase [Egibacteraceae bacterium]|nr:NAD(+)/NADH kinase [Egibacteraceae bacterium]